MVKLTIFISILSITLSAKDVERPNCEIRDIINKNIQPNQAIVTTPNGEMYHNPLFDGKADKTEIKTPKRTDAQLKAIFNRVRSDIINEIQNGVPYPKLHQFQKSMIDRLNFLNFKVAPCPHQSSTASFSLLTVGVEVCSHLRNLPEAALVAIFGHEMGHSLDLTNAGCAIYKIETPGAQLATFIPAELKSTVSGTSGTSSASSSSSRVVNDNHEGFDLEEFKMILNISSNSAHGISSCVFDTPEKVKVLEILERKGILRLHSEAIPITWNPLRGVYACLSKEFDWMPLPNTQIQAARGGYHDYGERSAQIWGSKAVEIFLKNNPSLSKHDILGLATAFNIQVNKGKKGIPAKEMELNQIYLSNSAIQKALDCKPITKHECSGHFKPHTGYPATPLQPSPGGATETPQENVR